MNPQMTYVRSNPHHYSGATGFDTRKGEKLGKSQAACLPGVVWVPLSFFPDYPFGWWAEVQLPDQPRQVRNRCHKIFTKPT